MKYSSNRLPTVYNILVCLSQGANTVTEIARIAKLSISTTHRLLNVLIDPGFTITIQQITSIIWAL